MDGASERLPRNSSHQQICQFPRDRVRRNKVDRDAQVRGDDPQGQRPHGCERQRQRLAAEISRHRYRLNPILIQACSRDFDDKDRRCQLNQGHRADHQNGPLRRYQVPRQGVQDQGQERSGQDSLLGRNLPTQRPADQLEHGAGGDGRRRDY